MAPTKTEKKGKAQEVKAKAVPKKAEVAKAAPKKVEDKKGAKKAPAKKESSSEEESSEEEEEEEESSEEEKESEEKEESSEEESSEEEEEEKEKEEEEESSSEEEEEEKDSSEEESSEEEESEDDDEEEEEEAKPAAKKRKNDEESEQPSKRQAVEGTKLFVASLPYSIDSDGLAELFGKFGNVTDAFVSVDNGRSKGFGFVTFDSEASAKKALKMNGHEIDGRALKVEISRPKEAGGKPERKPFQSQGSSEASKVLFVGNLSFNTGKDELIEAFGSCDGLQDARVATERETGRPRGFGYVEFDSAENAKAAMDSMGGADVGGRNIRLDFAGERSSNGGGDRGGYGGDRGGFRGGRGGFRGGDRGGFRGGRGGGDRGGFRGGRGGGDRGGFRGGRGGFRGGRGGSFGGGEGRKTTFDD